MGKARIQIRHLLSHTSGVSGWEQPITLEDLYDWDKSTSLLSAQAGWWEPGTVSGYHMLTYDHLIGEVVRRITDRRLGEFIRNAAEHYGGISRKVPGIAPGNYSWILFDLQEHRPVVRLSTIRALQVESE